MDQANKSHANGQPKVPQQCLTSTESVPAPLPPCAYHGKCLCGLLSTTKSTTFEGRFGRLFHCLPGAKYGVLEAQSRSALESLGSLMTAGFDAPKDGLDSEESAIPSLYTYFGQFIDHDITFDPMSALTKHFDPDALTDFRTPALDLDNIYGRGPSDQPYMYASDGTRFLLGAKLGHNTFDLPRSAAEPARAIIGDPRNDENSIVSQFQGLMLQFHNRVVADHPELNNPQSFPQLQEIVRWHYQWVVLHDFLPRIIIEDVLNDLKTDGMYDQKKLRFFNWKNNPFMPVEFSAAAYRLGHSMIRPGYRLNSDDASLLPIFPVNGMPEGLTGFVAMAPNRAIDWGRFIDTGLPRPTGPPAVDGEEPTKQMKNRLQLAYRLDASIVSPLQGLPSSVAPDAPPSLAQRNLLRGFELDLPSGQKVARAMGLTPLSDEELFIGKAGDDDDAKISITNLIAKHPELACFAGNLPLWTYILAEAAANATDIEAPVEPAGTKISTPRLGHVGGRIVAEVFLGLLFGDRSSFLACEPTWKPTIRGVGMEFKLRDIVSYALGEPSPAAKSKI